MDIKVNLTIATIYTKLYDGVTGVHKYCILGKKSKKEVKEMFLDIYAGNGIDKCQVIELDKKTDNIELSVEDIENKPISDVISSYCNYSYDTESMLLWFIMFHVNILNKKYYKEKER